VEFYTHSRTLIHTHTKNEFVQLKLNATRALYLIRCTLYNLLFKYKFKKVTRDEKGKNIITCNWTMDHKLFRRNLITDHVDKKISCLLTIPIYLSFLNI